MDTVCGRTHRLLLTFTRKKHVSYVIFTKKELIRTLKTCTNDILATKTFESWPKPSFASTGMCVWTNGAACMTKIRSSLVGDAPTEQLTQMSPQLWSVIRTLEMTIFPNGFVLSLSLPMNCNNRPSGHLRTKSSIFFLRVKVNIFEKELPFHEKYTFSQLWVEIFFLRKVRKFVKIFSWLYWDATCR